ncbi:MAG: 3-isopropylmalate dehydratase [Planctomycetota bacterium]
MRDTIRGKAFVLGDNIDTDQIIPAQRLVYDPTDPEQRKLYGKYALSGVPKDQSGLPEGNTPFVAEGAQKSDFAVIVAGRNFGCGSSREHAPLAISEAGCVAVIAESYARIFYRNSVNGGYLVPLETPQRLVDAIATGADVGLDLTEGVLTDTATGKQYKLNPLGDVAEIVAAGGIFDYARKTGLLETK